MNITQYPFRTIDVICHIDFESLSLINSRETAKNIETQFFKIDSYYKYVNICKCSDISDIDFSKETLLLIIEAEGHNSTNINANDVFVLRDRERKRIICVIKKYYCNRWDYLGWDIVGVVIPQIPYDYKFEFVIDYIENN